MTEDLEKLLESVAPRGAPPELRGRVLDRVAEVLRAAEPGAAESGAAEPGATGVSPVWLPRHGQDLPGARRHPLGRVLAWSVAAGLLLGVGLNFAAVRIGEARLAKYERPLPEPVSTEQLAVALAQGDQRGADRWEELWAAGRWSGRRGPDEALLRQYEDVLEQTLSMLKEPIHAACQENPEVDVHRRRGAGGDTTDCQRLFRLDHRLTA